MHKAEKKCTRFATLAEYSTPRRIIYSALQSLLLVYYDLDFNILRNMIKIIINILILLLEVFLILLLLAF